MQHNGELEHDKWCTHSFLQCMTIMNQNMLTMCVRNNCCTFMANQNMMTICVGNNDDNNGEHDFANPRRRKTLKKLGFAKKKNNCVVGAKV